METKIRRAARTCRGWGRYAIRCHKRTAHPSGFCHNHRGQEPEVERAFRELRKGAPVDTGKLSRGGG